jgi:hypothetical protein
MKRVIALLTLLLLVASCSSDEKPAAVPSPGASATGAPTQTALTAGPIPTFCSGQSPVISRPGVIHEMVRPARVGKFSLQPDSAQTKAARAALAKSTTGSNASVLSVDKYVAAGSTAVVSVIEGIPGEYYKARVNFLCGSATRSKVSGPVLKSARGVAVSGFDDPVVCFAPSTEAGVTVTTCGWFDDYAVSIDLVGADTNQTQPFAVAYRQAAER